MRLVPRRNRARGKDHGPSEPAAPDQTITQTMTEPGPPPGPGPAPSAAVAPEGRKPRRRGDRKRRRKRGAPILNGPAEGAPGQAAAPQRVSLSKTKPLPQPPLTEEARLKEARAADRARRAAALRRTQEQRRARAKRLQAETQRRPRSGLMALIIILGVMIAAVAVTGALLVTSRENKPVPLAAPLHVYPVTQVLTGACPGGTQGINGQTPAGLSCYQLSSGIAIRRVADLRVQRGATAGTHDVAISLVSTDRRAFADLTRGTVGRYVAFVVRDRLVTAPKVDMPITGGKIVVTGGFSQQDATSLVRTLKGS